MAYSFDHPLLVIVEKGLKQEGLLSNNRDWFVQEVAIRPETMQDREFQGIFFHWRLRVEKFGTGGGRQRTNANDRVDVNSMTASELLRSMTPAQVWSVESALASVVLGVAYIAFKIGQSGVSP